MLCSGPLQLAAAELLSDEPVEESGEITLDEFVGGCALDYIS